MYIRRQRRFSFLYPILSSVIFMALLNGLFGMHALAQDTAPQRWQKIPTSALGLNTPHTIAFDAAGRAWIGGRGGALVLQPDGAKAAQYALPPAALVTAIAFDTAQVVWLAADEAAGETTGLRAIAPSGSYVDYSVTDGLTDNHVRALAIGEAGDLWLATAGGLGHRSLDGSWGRFTQTEGLIHDDVYALALDSRGDLWIGTIAGLSRLSTAGLWESYTAGDGLVAPWISRLVVDRLDNLWCAAEAGVSVRAPNGVWESVGAEEGLPTDVITALAADATGGVWLATAAGVVYGTREGPWTRLDADPASGLIDALIPGIAVDAAGRAWFVGPAGVSILLEGGPAAGRRVIPLREKVLAPTPTSASSAISRSAATPISLTAASTPPISAVAPFVTLGSVRISRTAFFILFFAIFGLAVAGAILLTVRIILRSRRKRVTAVSPAPTPLTPETPRPRDEDILLPARLSSDEPMAPEVEAALAELDRYANGSSSTSVINPAALSPLEPAITQEPTDPADGTETTASDGMMSPMPTNADAMLQMRLQQAGLADVPDLMREGRDLARAGDKATAYDVFSAVTRLAPDNVDAWMWKGGTALHPQEAVRCLQRAIELEPDNLKARAGLNWALTYLAAGEVADDANG